MTSTVLGKIDLGPDMPGYELELRRLVLPPGAANGTHTHARRPGFGYVLQGTLTENRVGGTSSECGPGALITESRDVKHSVANHGVDPVELLAVHVNRKH